MRMVADRIDALLADQGYDADTICEKLASANVEAVIPAKRNRRYPARRRLLSAANFAGVR